MYTVSFPNSNIFSFIYVLILVFPETDFAVLSIVDAHFWAQVILLSWPPE